MEKRRARLSKPAFEMEALPREARIFAEKAARSIIEVQDSIESVADIVILLEVTGITKEDLEQNGFNNMYDLAVYINSFIDFYEMRKKDKSKFMDAFLREVPSKKTKLMESLAMIFPWVSSLALFFVSGVSLWMVSRLPTDDITALMIGVFLGIFITEGPLAMFQRLFVINYTQLNTSEAMRTVKRNFVLISIILVPAASLLLLFGYLADSPTGLVLLSVVALITVSLHRASYMIIYALKKLRLLVISYSIALALLLLIYYLASDVMPDIGSRYLVALGVAFLWLSISAFYGYRKIFSSSSTRGAHPHFYRSPGALKNTIKARIRIQLWDAIPYYIFGTFLFAMMFGDRLISWFFNPILHSSEASLPLLFNTLYHSGADPATLVFLITSVAQYVIMNGFYQEMSNLTVTHRVTQIGKVNEFLKKRYRKLMLASIVTSCCIAVILNLLGQELMTQLGAPAVSLNILAIASIGNVFISIFVANSMFATFMNRIKALAIMALVATLILGLGGFVLAQEDFENIVYAYLASSIVSALLSSVYMMRKIKSASSIYFARFT
jgi:hypothetical protein